MQIPSVIFFANAEAFSSDITKNNIQVQLHIDEFVSDIEFNARIAVDPNYPIFVHLNNLRIIVMSQDMRDMTNRQYADTTIFLAHGLINVLQNNVGPPTISLPIEGINIFNLLAAIKLHTNFSCNRCNCGCRCNCFKHLLYQIQKLLINEYDISGAHTANCDNPYLNTDWLNRG